MDIFALVKAALFAVIALIATLGSLLTGLGGYTTSVQNPIPTPSTTSFPAATSTTAMPVKSVTVATTTAEKPVVATTPTPLSSPSLPQLSTETLNALARPAVVNIFCQTRTGGSFNPISGSGVLIDSRGIILTNAHVAQFLLLKDYPAPGSIECTIRTGSPAQPRYTAELLYLPPQWISANASKIKTPNPTGTGEYDYALLRITGTTNPQNPLPASFPALPMEGSAPSTGDGAFIAAYPAGFLGGINISNNLYLTSANATVGRLFTFSDAQTVDLFSLGGTIVAQSGSSGGPVLSSSGKLQGLVVTEVPAETTSGRDLRALSLEYIDRSLKELGKGGIAGLLLQDPVSAALQFNAAVAPNEREALIEALK